MAISAQTRISGPHIFTLTGNLLAERTLEFEAWSPGRTQRASRESFQVGGKGINVSRMLARLRNPELSNQLTTNEYAIAVFPSDLSK